jgi:phospholipase/lecithinase/hemolysin
MLRLLNSGVFTAALFISLVIASPLHPTFSWSQTKYFLAFGDSYTYVQGTHGRQNYSFIGDYLSLPFTPSDLLSNRIVQNQTSTAEGGPNWVEYLTGCGLKPGLTNPRDCDIQLWDFAFGGADISEEYLPLHHNYTTSLVKQVEQFAQYGQPVLKRFVDPRDTLVAVWIGINDINDSAKLGLGSPAFFEQLISTLFESVTTIYELGYKKFLFMNLPPLDRTPANLIRDGGPSPNTTMIGWWDSTLLRHAQTFAREHRGARAMVFDANKFLNEVLDEHDRFGIKNVTNFCPAYDQPYINTDPAKYGCQPLEEFFWFNSGHTTSHTHEILAGAVRKFLESQ